MAWFTTTVDRHIAAGADPVLATFEAIAEWVTAPATPARLHQLTRRDQRDRPTPTARSSPPTSATWSSTLPNSLHGTIPNAPSWFPAALAVIVDGAIVQCTIFARTEPLDAADPPSVNSSKRSRHDPHRRRAALSAKAPTVLNGLGLVTPAAGNPRR